jgi:hypothetical protein
MVLLQTQKAMAYGWKRVVTPIFLGTNQFVENKIMRLKISHICAGILGAKLENVLQSRHGAFAYRKQQGAEVFE